MNNGDSSTEDFNILDIVEGQEGDGSKGMNILDDVVDKDTKKGGEDETKTQPYISGVTGQTGDPLGYRGNRAQAGTDSFIFFPLKYIFLAFSDFLYFFCSGFSQTETEHEVPASVESQDS